jgi:hypothetical protein
VGEDGGEFLTTPLGMPCAMLERVLVDQVIEVAREFAGHFGWASRAGAIGEALYPLMGKAMDPFPQGRIGKVERVRDRVQALAFDDLAYGLRPTEDPRFLGLFEEGLSGGEGLIRKVECEGSHQGGLQEKVLQKFA